MILPWLPYIRIYTLLRPLPRNILTLSSPIAVPLAFAQTTTVEVIDDPIKQALPISRDLSLPAMDLLPQATVKDIKAAETLDGGQGFSSRGGRGGRGGHYGAARSTGVCYAEEVAPPEPDHEASNPPDLDAYTEEHHAEQYDDSFYAGVQEYHTPPGHYEAYYNDTYEGPHPWDYNEDYGEY